MSITFYAVGQDGVCRGEGVNMANGNAFMVLREMGIEPDYHGQHDAQDFYERALTLTAVEAITPEHEMNRHDPFTSEIVLALAGPLGEGGPKIIQGQLSDDYFEQRGAQLMAIAQQALEAGTQVVWF